MCPKPHTVRCGAAALALMELSGSGVHSDDRAVMCVVSCGVAE